MIAFFRMGKGKARNLEHANSEHVNKKSKGFKKWFNRKILRPLVNKHGTAVVNAISSATGTVGGAIGGVVGGAKGATIGAALGRQAGDYAGRKAVHKGQKQLNKGQKHHVIAIGGESLS